MVSALLVLTPLTSPPLLASNTIYVRHIPKSLPVSPDSYTYCFFPFLWRCERQLQLTMVKTKHLVFPSDLPTTASTQILETPSFQLL